MAAATSPIATPHKTDSVGFYKLAASTTIYGGTMVALNAAGYAIPAADTASTKVVGVADETVKNESATAGAANVRVKRGVFKFKNASANPVVQATLHSNALVVDNQTVGADTTNDIVAGRVEALDPDGVWVRIV